MPLSPEEVGLRIRAARDEKQPKPWSQFDLALAMEVSPSTIYHWEKGKLPSMAKLIRLAEVLDKPPDYLTEPPERQVDLAGLRDQLDGLDHRLESLEASLELSREAVVEALASIHDQLVQIRESHVSRDAQAN